jgi:hypothetical protein
MYPTAPEPISECFPRIGYSDIGSEKSIFRMQE